MISTLIIREYKPNDCVLLAQLFYETVHTVNKGDYTKKQLDAWATGNVDLDEWNNSFLKHFTFVAMIGSEIVGFADMDISGYIDRLYVHKDYQNIGIGKALLKSLEQVAADKKIVCLVTFASVTAKPFFERFGYVVLNENLAIRNGVKLKNYKMSKNINTDF